MTGSDIEITFLGTGSTIPPLDRQQVSFALRQAVGLILFDCGEGTQYSLRKYKISTRREFVICISHLHADHFLGLPGLLSSMELLDREKEIKIIGPTGILNTVENLLKSNFIGLNFPLRVYEMRPGSIYNGKGYTIQTYAAKHEANALSYLYEENEFRGKVDLGKIEELGIPQGPLVGELLKGKTIEINGSQITRDNIIGQSIPGRRVFYSGDTAYNQEVVEEIPQSCDLVVHEGTYPSGMNELAADRNHSTVEDAAKFAKENQASQLIITHISPRILNLDQELQNAQEIYPNTIFAYEGLEYRIPIKR